MGLGLLAVGLVTLMQFGPSLSSSSDAPIYMTHQSALSTDPAPGMEGATFGDLRPTSINANGATAFNDGHGTAIFTTADGGEVEFLLIDEDTIDNGIGSIQDISFNPPNCGASDPAVCVNDDIAAPGVRTPVFMRGNDITPFSGLELPTGQIGDEGLFRFTKPDQAKPWPSVLPKAHCLSKRLWKFVGRLLKE